MQTWRVFAEPVCYKHVCQHINTIVSVLFHCRILLQFVLQHVSVTVLMIVCTCVYIFVYICICGTLSLILAILVSHSYIAKIK